MAMRAPSFARRIAIPRPIPRVPPVINATLLRSAIPALVSYLKLFSSIAEPLDSNETGVNAGAQQSPSCRLLVPAFLPIPPQPASCLLQFGSECQCSIGSQHPATVGCRILRRKRFQVPPDRRCTPLGSHLAEWSPGPLRKRSLPLRPAPSRP